MPTQTTRYGEQDTGSIHDLREKATDQFDKLSDTVVDRFRDAADQAEHFAGRVAGQGREVRKEVQEAAANLKGAVDKSLKDQPMATLAMAAVLGFVLGALWKK